MNHCDCKHRGYVLFLLLLAGVVVGAILFINPRAIFNRGPQVDENGVILPWTEENRLVKSDASVKMPNSEQVSLQGITSYKADLKEGNDARGEIVFLVKPDGRLKGNWTGDFSESSQVSCAVLSSAFTGNIDSSKVFKDKSRRDKSKLFFIGKGGFIMLVDNKSNHERPERRGEIFVTGWIDKDGSISDAIVHVTSDREKYKIYKFENCTQGKGLVLPGL